jgi:hypothetical protein
VLASLAREKIAGYENSVQMYTDASKNLEGKVGIGCYVKATSRDRRDQALRAISQAAR